MAKFVRDCQVCQLIRSAMNRQIMTYHFTTASYTPMKVLNIDTIGLVTHDAAEKNSSYILLVIGCFTRFIELLPSR